jgi:hypothetical protein
MVTDETMDNSVFGIDILGSWMEVGMIGLAMVAGVIIMIPTVWNMVKRRKKCSFCPTSPTYRKLHSRIHEFLTELRVKLDADRAVILQFHNGGNFLDGSSIKRFSLSHESVIVGTTESINTRQNNQISNYVEMLDMLSKEEIDSSIVMTSDMRDCHFKRHLESNHTLVFSIHPLKDSRGVLTTGALLVEWCTWDQADKIDDEKVTVTIKDFGRYLESQLAGAAHAS